MTQKWMNDGENMSHMDIRWIQRFDNYCKALNQLTKFMEKGALNND